MLDQILGVRVQAHRDRGADLRQSAEVGDQHSGDRLVVAAGEVNTDGAFGLVDVDVPGHPPDAFGDDRGIVGFDRIVFVGDLANEFLSQVLKGEDPGESAVLIDHAGELILGRG